MSEEINLNDPNLCTTEEAFEQFQAVSTYEEEDFITLSDILPPPSPEHNPVSELDDVPYDNEVELPAFLEQPQQEVSSVSAPYIQSDTVVNTTTVVESGVDTVVNATTVAESDVSVSTEQSAMTDDQHALPIVNNKPKRGRKKRESTLAPAPEMFDESNVAADSSSQQNENYETTSAALRPRRGRAKKSLDGSLNSSNYADIPKTQKRIRGRPKKQLLEEECVTNESQNGQYAELSNDNTEVSDTSANVRKKTPRRRAQAKNISSDALDATEDILKNNLDGNNLETTDSMLQDPAAKVPKRTRKRKANKNESDDDDDDLSLSQIKKDGTKINGAENVALEEDPIAKFIPQELGVESQLIPDPNEQNGNISEMILNKENMIDADQMLLDNEIVVRNDDMEIDIVGTEETKFYPIPQENPPENSVITSSKDEQSISDNVEIKKENEGVDNLLVEDTTKRPVRRKAKKTLHYDEGSDEDPFANVELSDDEPSTRKKGKRYNSDDEYVPGKKQSSSDISDSDVDEHFGVIKPKRKRGRSGISQNRSPRKINRSFEQFVEEMKPDVATITPHTADQEDDIEECLQTSVIKAPDEFNQFKAKNGKMSEHNSEFENFLAQKIHGTDLQIKKVSSSEPLQTAPLAIPVLDPKELKKTVENCTQTTSAKMQAIGTQTSTLYDAPMKKNITLSAQQSEKACEFLKSVVKTTAELGQLMTQKSEDFITKKINTDHVTDTLKMDYCVRKSFLLFKLAKHNLVQMEEDLSKQYDEFLKENKLESCRDKPKEVVPKSKPPDSDSDCEFVEETKPGTSKQKPKFNPKTVFLNKELSIKIAKKPDPVNKPNKKNLNIKGKHSVWISDSVMVKKVAPTQSFLEQDSRNKKPPDTYVTEKMVSDFFEEYTHRQIQGVCAPFTSTEWLTPIRTNVCSYYFVKTDSLTETAECFSENDDLSKTPGQDCSTSEVGKSLNLVTTMAVDKQHSSPESLSTLCTQILRKYLQEPNINGLMPLIENGYSNDSKVPNVEKTETPRSLFQLCLNSLMQDLNSHTINHSPSLSNVYNFTMSPEVIYNALPLKNICSSKIIAMCTSSISPEQKNSVISRTYSPTYSAYEDSILSDNISDDEDFTVEINKVKSLFSLCLDRIQNNQYPDKVMHKFTEEKMEQHVLACFEPDCLKRIAFETVKFLMYKNYIFDIDDELTSNGTMKNITMKYKVKRLADICFEIVSKSCDGTEEQSNASAKLTINSVNTLSEEAFHNIDQSCQNTAESSQFLDEEEDETNYYDDDSYDASTTNNYEEDSQTEESNWVSKLQMKELMSCIAIDRNSNENQISENDESPTNSEEQPIIARIKIEPAEEITENVVDPAIVKVEPLHNLNEMTVIPDGVFTKQEHDETSPVDPIEQNQTLRRASFDMNTFEDFVRSNKMMHNAGEYSSTADEIFSQSGLRVRRQYEPDSDNENIENDPKDLLVPQTFEPLTIETAKDHLMESSSDEGSSKKATDKKKPDKRGRGRPRKQEKQQTTKEKEKVAPPIPTNEVARLTKRMRERIRQEEKKVESSDSDTDTLPLSKRKDKTKPDNKNVEDEIQCNNVDSTEQVEKVSPGHDDFQGFSAVDQNEITSYQKYVKFVYDKIMPQEDDSAKGSDNSNLAVSTSADDATPLINPDEPVEMLECEPTMPIFDEETVDKTQRKTKKSANKQKTKEKIVPEQKIKQGAEEKTKQDAKEKTEDSPPLYTERDGWKLYPISSKESKLYENCGIILEKLPESFVETYFRYQNITVTRKEDEEVNRLINLNTLNRSGNVRDGKKHKAKGKDPGTQAEGNGFEGSRAASPANSDRYDELTPSEDETNVDDEVPPPAPRQGGENNLAKNLLMGDSDSDGEKRIKTELNDESETPTDKSKKKKLSPKSKAVEKTTESPENLMLTADKMMNKELNLLHAPVVLDDNDAAETSTPKGPVTRHKRRGGSSKHSKHMEKNEDDSSSEEEKQWVSTKEKLLKRMGKKDTAIEDDAKRAKLEKEFIERRGDDAQKRRRGRGRPRKLSSRALLEREKQLRVLSKEMMSEGDARLHAAKQSQSYFKGRRNIRKVIDKKSLQRSTVIANMEEFERKCRLNQRQARLREILGCEENVNVVVMNDELCLEYDFQQQQAAVSVHPFFTKVMKAHQYEGVKFMWDACFESLEKVESGHQGGGCILAHCMGLGKTLQVLALLHTVLTHPRVGIQRVLVCCPLSTVLNWVDEIHKWIGPVTDQIKVFELSKLKKTYERAYQLEDWYNGGGIFIIGYELFRSLSLLDPVLDDVRPTIVNKIRMALLDPGPDIVICDEGHLLKNDCSVLAVAMSRVQTRRRIVLTGTPMQNNLREYYCMVNFVKPNLLGTYSEYSNRFENPIMNGQHRDSLKDDIKLMKQRTHILHKVLEGCLQRQEASVLYPYLPKKHEYTVFISLTECQWDLYKHYMNNYARQSKQNVLKDFHILQKIWSHPQVLHNFLMRWRENKAKEAGEKIKPEKVEDDLAQEDLAATSAMELKPAEAETWWLQYLDGGQMLDTLASSNKFVAVFRILDECIELGDKVLIFSTSLITMDTLEFFLKKINKWSLGQEYYRLDGSVPPEVRQKWCREFNAENNHKTKLFLISTRAGCLGLNMVAANRVIILDTSWNPAHDIQSIFRVYRFGQKKDCYIYRLVALGTMEQKIYERSVTKQAVACRVVDEQQIDRHYNMAELTELYKYDEHGISVAGGVAVGVEDVALLRVARDAALHAVHEHDSLLRGSSETALPEHERNAAWMQFQQEQTHKQIQNQLTPMPVVKHTYGPKKNQQNMPPLLQPTEIKSEDQITPVPYQVPVTFEPPPETKGKKGRKAAQANNEQQPLALDDNIVQKIMNILIKHNYQKRQGPKEISELVASVRKIVAYGKVPPKLGLDQELTQSIANVLLGRDSPPPLTDVKPQIEIRRKQTFEPEEILPSTSSDPTDGRRRRRAALAAKQQIDSLGSDAVIDLDDDDWQGGSDTDDAPEIANIQKPIEKPVEKPKPMSKKAKRNLVLTEKQLNSEISSILLSDDEDVPSKAKDKTADSGELVPLHPSLLSNKNFIKIVAHTYLEGNPMLDEDAATLAAQYSTLKALKEFESTGRKIENGPIYDIAIKVLGKDILKKLNKSNPAIPKPSAPATSTPTSQPLEVKTEPDDPQPRSTGRVKPKGISELIAPPAPEEKRKRGRPSRASILALQAAMAAPSPAVIPVGLIKMAGASQSPQPLAPVPAPQPQPPPFPADGEESILPDDDVTIPQPPIKTEPRKNSQPLILNTVLSQSTKNNTPVIVRRHAAPKIQISSGSIVMSHSTPLTTTAPMTPPQNSDATICLDSDEEESITPNLPTKRVALKSTATRPVNVTTFMAEPQQPPHSQPSNLPPNCIVIPAADFERLRKIPMGLVPHNQMMQQQSMMQQQAMMQQHAMMQQGYMPQNMNLVSIPQSVNMMGTHQNLNYANPQMLNFTQVPAQSAPLMTALPQTSAAPTQPPTMAPPARQASPQSILPTPADPPPASKKSKLNKTVCKPGDILRITPSGQVEILQRDDEPVQQPAAPPRAPGIAKKSTTKPPMATRSSSNVVSLDDDNDDQSAPEAKKPKSRVRKLSSSSSSSSESSRHSSPERDDPLSILKDVVHIRAADDDAPKKQSKSTAKPAAIPIRRVDDDALKKQTRATAKPQATSQPQSQIGSISITKSAPTSKSRTAPPVKNSISITPTKDKVMSLINQTDSMLKQLNSVLASDKKTSKTKIDNKSQKVVDSVDLTDLDAPSTSSNKRGKNEIVTKYSAKGPAKGSSQQTSLLKKASSSPVPGSRSGILVPTKVVGKSSNIILKNTGGKKQVMVMSERAAAPAAKRAAPAPPPPHAKKKKNEPMTLKDFDIDDIDDIIELD